MRETCTPTLGQSETCETCQHRFHEVSIKHAETGQHRCHKVSIKCAQGFFPRWTKATGTYIHNQVTQVSKTWPNMAATEANIASTQFLSNRHKSKTCKTSTSMSPSATPATQMERQCHQVRLLPRKWNVNVTKRNACHAKWRSAWATNRAQARHQSQPSATSATPAMQMEGQCHQVPRLPRKWNVNVTKCYAFHAKMVCDKVA